MIVLNSQIINKFDHKILHNENREYVITNLFRMRAKTEKKEKRNIFP